MKIEFVLITRHGHVGEFYYDWQCPFVPRIGEGVHVENIFDEGQFVVSDDDHVESNLKHESIEQYVCGHLWRVTDITWCKKEQYSLIISLFGE